MCCRFLDPQYRRPLILRELLGFHADIICLQEVDEKAFAEYFLPQLQQAGALSSRYRKVHVTQFMVPDRQTEIIGSQCRIAGAVIWVSCNLLSGMHMHGTLALGFQQAASCLFKQSMQCHVRRPHHAPHLC